MDQIDWITIKSFIQLILKTVEFNIDKESFDFVKHYIDHDEYEMAFEGLFIEIMNLKEIPPIINLQESREIGLLLKLDKESVFDFEFWLKFELFIKANLNSHLV